MNDSYSAAMSMYISSTDNVSAWISAPKAVSSWLPWPEIWMLQVLALWLGRGLLGASSPDLAAAFARDFAAIALLLVALRVPGLLPGPRGVGALSTALGLLLGARAVGSLIGGLRNLGRDRFLEDYLRRKELDLEFEAVAARVPDEDGRPRRRRR